MADKEREACKDLPARTENPAALDHPDLTDLGEALEPSDLWESQDPRDLA